MEKKILFSILLVSIFLLIAFPGISATTFQDSCVVVTDDTENYDSVNNVYTVSDYSHTLNTELHKSPTDNNWISCNMRFELWEKPGTDMNHNGQPGEYLYNDTDDSKFGCKVTVGNWFKSNVLKGNCSYGLYDIHIRSLENDESAEKRKDITLNYQPTFPDSCVVVTDDTPNFDHTNNIFYVANNHWGGTNLKTELHKTPTDNNWISCTMRFELCEKPGTDMNHNGQPGETLFYEDDDNSGNCQVNVAKWFGANELANCGYGLYDIHIRSLENDESAEKRKDITLDYNERIKTHVSASGDTYNKRTNTLDINRLGDWRHLFGMKVFCGDANAGDGAVAVAGRIKAQLWEKNASDMDMNGYTGVFPLDHWERNVDECSNFLWTIDPKQFFTDNDNWGDGEYILKIFNDGGDIYQNSAPNLITLHVSGALRKRNHLEPYGTLFNNSTNVFTTNKNEISSDGNLNIKFFEDSENNVLSNFFEQLSGYSYEIPDDRNLTFEFWEKPDLDNNKNDKNGELILSVTGNKSVNPAFLNDINILPIGMYDLKICFNGDDRYRPSEKVITLDMRDVREVTTIKAYGSCLSLNDTFNTNIYRVGNDSDLNVYLCYNNSDGTVTNVTDKKPFCFELWETKGNEIDNDGYIEEILYQNRTDHVNPARWYKDNLTNSVSGDFDLKIKFLGDDNYRPSEKIIRVHIGNDDRMNTTIMPYGSLFNNSSDVFTTNRSNIGGTNFNLMLNLVAQGTNVTGKLFKFEFWEKPESDNNGNERTGEKLYPINGTLSGNGSINPAYHNSLGKVPCGMCDLKIFFEGDNEYKPANTTITLNIQDIRILTYIVPYGNKLNNISGIFTAATNQTDYLYMLLCYNNSNGTVTNVTNKTYLFELWEPSNKTNDVNGDCLITQLGLGTGNKISPASWWDGTHVVMGEYDLKVKFLGDDNYRPSEKIVPIIIR